MEKIINLVLADSILFSVIGFLLIYSIFATVKWGKARSRGKEILEEKNEISRELIVEKLRNDLRFDSLDFTIASRAEKYEKLGGDLVTFFEYAVRRIADEIKLTKNFQELYAVLENFSLLDEQFLPKEGIFFDILAESPAVKYIKPTILSHCDKEAKEFDELRRNIPRGEERRLKEIEEKLNNVSKTKFLEKVEVKINFSPHGASPILHKAI